MGNSAAYVDELRNELSLLEKGLARASDVIDAAKRFITYVDGVPMDSAPGGAGGKQMSPIQIGGDENTGVFVDHNGFTFERPLAR